jgi:putative glutamine amidotransferase
VLGRALGDADSCPVNSRHHQSVGRVAPHLAASATAPDGIVEGIESPDARFCVGVQWHPENFWRTGEFKPLFDAFIEATKKD